MGQKVEVGGTGRDLKGGKALIGGTAYAIKKGRTLIGGTGYDISLMSGTPISELPVGSIVKTSVDGTLRDFLIVHQGLPSSLYDDSCNGTWLLMKDVYETRQWHSYDYSDYKTSSIHSYLNSTFLGLFDSNIKDAIKQVKIPYVNGAGNSAVASGANGLSAKVFLLSGYEVGWTTSDSSYFPVDGAKLDYFAASSGGNSKRIAYLNGSAVFWWLRSPYTVGASFVWHVDDNGPYSRYYASNPGGIRPALVLPSDTLVSDDGTIAV